MTKTTFTLSALTSWIKQTGSHDPRPFPHPVFGRLHAPWMSTICLPDVTAILPGLPTLYLHTASSKTGAYLHQIGALEYVFLSAERVHLIWQPQTSSSKPVRFPQNVCKGYRKSETQHALPIVRRNRILD